MDALTSYHYEKYSFKIITPLLGLVGFAFLFNGEFVVGPIIVVLGALSAFSYQGIIIDLAGKRYLKYDRFLKFRIGGWKNLPSPSYVTIVRITLSNQRTAPAPFVAPEDKKGARAYKVNLVVEGKTRFLSVCRGSRDVMTREALRLGNLMQLRVLDYTTHNKKWIS